MKEELLQILIKLKENESWELAEQLSIGLYNSKNIKPSYINFIINFLDIEIKNANNSSKIKILKHASNKMRELRLKEEKERIEEELNLKEIEELSQDEKFLYSYIHNTDNIKYADQNIIYQENPELDEILKKELD